MNWIKEKPVKRFDFLREGMCRHCLLESVHIVRHPVYLVCVPLVTMCIVSQINCTLNGNCSQTLTFLFIFVVQPAIQVSLEMQRGKAACLLHLYCGLSGALDLCGM